MEKIVRKIVRRERIIVRYQCSVCKGEYKNKAEARECEREPIVRPVHNIGDRVIAFGLEKQRCWKCCRKFSTRIIITKRQGPSRSNHILHQGHLHLYDVIYACPFCKEKHGTQLWPSHIKRAYRTKQSVKN